MALVKSRPGAYAQAEQGGASPSFLRIALLRSDAMKAAMQRTYGRQYNQAQQGLSLSGMIADKQLEQRQQIANKRLGVQRHMFEKDMQMQNQRFEANRPSDLEMGIGSVLPYAAGAYASYRDKQVTDEHQQRMEGLYAEQGINYKADLLSQQLGYAGYQKESVPQTMQRAGALAPQQLMTRGLPQAQPGQMQFQPNLSRAYTRQEEEEQYRPRFGGF